MSAYNTNADDGASYRFSVDLLGGLNAEHLCCLWELLSRHAGSSDLRRVAEELDELLSPPALCAHPHAGARQP